MIKDNQSEFREKVDDIINHWHLIAMGYSIDDYALRNVTFSHLKKFATMVKTFSRVCNDYATYSDEMLYDIISDIEENYVRFLELCSEDIEVQFMYNRRRNKFNKSLDLIVINNAIKGS